MKGAKGAKERSSGGVDEWEWRGKIVEAEEREREGGEEQGAQEGRNKEQKR